MDHYKDYLEIIQKDIGNITTSNHELNDYCSIVFGKKFKGVYSLDNIPKIKTGQCCIFNLDKQNQTGSHWMGLYKDGKQHIVYDSFGRTSKKLNVPLKNIKDTDYDKEQKIKETNCGQRCIAFLCCCYTLPIDDVLKI